MGNDSSTTNESSKGMCLFASCLADPRKAIHDGKDSPDTKKRKPASSQKSSESNISTNSRITLATDTNDIVADYSSDTTHTHTNQQHQHYHQDSYRKDNNTMTKQQTSAESFDRQDKRNRVTKKKAGRGSEGVRITNKFSSVREAYHIEPKELGHGHYGVVRKCMHRKTKEWFAIKSIRKSKVNRVDVLKREIALLQEVDHPNIIKLNDVFEDDKYLHLITELCSGGELFDRIMEKAQSPEGHFFEKDAANLIRSILDAIAYCHDEKNIVHRDLKPENFLFDSKAEDANVKIIDFGLSRHDTHSGVMHTKVGTPYYVAPEVLRKLYTNKCDVWSIGVITYILLCGYPPFYGDSDTEIFDSVKTGQFDFPSPEWDTISSDAKDFICSLLQFDPEERPDAREALKHSWIQKQTESNALFKKKTKRASDFRKFVGLQKLKKEAQKYIASTLTEGEIGNLGDVFRSLDTDKDGYMSLKELDAAVEKNGVPAELKKNLIAIREELRIDGETKMDWRAFLAGMTGRAVLLKEDKIRMAFEHFDMSKSNNVTLADLVKHFGGEAIANEIMGDVDLNKDGKISYEEFRDMLMTSSVESVQY